MALTAVKRRHLRAVQQQQSLSVQGTFRLLLTAVTVLLLGFFPQLHHRMMVNGDDSLETLDHVICLRSNGFFPHDLRCDHFYECRNATIINEGICKAGLRFDYRYRKKPRCIAADLIDCRITQLPEGSGNGNIPPATTMLFELTTERTTPAPPTTTERFTFPPFTTIKTTTTTSTTTTPAPRIVFTTTTQSPPPTTKNHFFDSPPTPTVWPTHMSTRSRSRSHSKPKSLQKLVEEEVMLMTPAPDEDEDDSDRRRTHNHNHNHHLDDNTLTKKRKLLRKPLKLRRGHLQSAEPASSSSFLGGHHTSSQGSSSGHLTAASGGGSSNNIVADDDPHSSHNSLLSRSISSDFSPAPKPQVQSTSLATTSTSSTSACPQLHGYFADRDDCRKFYACDDGRAFPMSCPLGLAYDELSGTCNWPDMVEGCRSEEMLRFTCPDPYENDILDYGDPRYPTSDCRKFVVCVLTDLYGSRTPRLLGCEEGLVFNPITKACDYPENVPTCANYYDSNPAALASNRYRRAQVAQPKKRRSRH